MLYRGLGYKVDKGLAIQILKSIIDGFDKKD